MRALRIISVVLAILTVSVPIAAKEPKLDRRIPAADPSVYEPLMANTWPNPRVMVDTEGVYLFVDGKTNPGSPTPVDDLKRALVKLPRERWTWGRIVALSKSPRMPRDVEGAPAPDDPRFATFFRVREILKSLGLVVIESPVGCNCK